MEEIFCKPKDEPRWVLNPEYCSGVTEAHCSRCGQGVVYIVYNNTWQFANFCPKCGARMANARVDCYDWDTDEKGDF